MTREFLCVELATSCPNRISLLGVMSGKWGVIPAHLESARLPRKLLRTISGHPLIVWVHHRANLARSLDGLLVATDSQEILEACKRYGIRAAMTSPEHRSGTDRIFEVVERNLIGSDNPDTNDVYVNIQGDEPMILAEHIDLLLRPFTAKFPSVDRESQKGAACVEVSTLKVAISAEEARNPNNVKVVTDKSGRALYFSRAMIPYDRDGTGEVRYYKHMGLYAYRASALTKFHELPPSALETTERLEQLRFLDHGIGISVAETTQDTIGVDTEEDLQKVQEYFEKTGIELPLGPSSQA